MRLLLAALAAVVCCALTTFPAYGRDLPPREIVRAHLAALHAEHADAVKYVTIADISQKLLLPMVPAESPDARRVLSALDALRRNALPGYRQACRLLSPTLETRRVGVERCARLLLDSRNIVESFAIGRVRVDGGRALVEATVNRERGVVLLAREQGAWRIVGVEPLRPAGGGGVKQLTS